MKMLNPNEIRVLAGIIFESVIKFPCPSMFAEEELSDEEEDKLSNEILRFNKERSRYIESRVNEEPFLPRYNEISEELIEFLENYFIEEK